MPRHISRSTASARRSFSWQIAAPNFITLLALCAGLTGLVMAANGRIADAVACILIAALLDGCDGRVARLTGGASKFGAELDSLADVVSFGAVPAFILYQWGLSQFGLAGWIPCLALASCSALRLARFNVMTADPNRPSWMAGYFTGVPAPGGAFLAMAPVYADLAGVIDPGYAASIALIWTAAVALLMVSRWPTFSGKSLGRKVPRLMLVPPILLAFLVLASLALWRWPTLLFLAVFYVSSLPFSLWRFQLLGRRQQSA
ncbi:MAG: CDP-diacylglycerol--serine O-phosphatidyltransferase [Hyphomicrobiales bacterium]